MALEHLLSNKKFNPDREVYLPCQSCLGDCCNPIPMTNRKLREVWKKYSLTEKLGTLDKNLPEYDSTYDGVDYYTVGKNDVYGRRVCVFKDSVGCNRCMIYEDRPDICRAFGETELLRCPYENLETAPQDVATRNSLLLVTDEYRAQLVGDAISKAQEENDIDSLIIMSKMG